MAGSLSLKRPRTIQSLSTCIIIFVKRMKWISICSIYLYFKCIYRTLVNEIFVYCMILYKSNVQSIKIQYNTILHTPCVDGLNCQFLLLLLERATRKHDEERNIDS